MSDPDAVPSLVFRVGVTGARSLVPEQIESLRAQVDAVLRRVKSEVAALSAHDCAKTVYAHDAAGHVPFGLRMVSPLADGSDRLVAEAALDLGFDLIAPLPFAQADYETDFPDAVEAFRGLLGKARVIELDGGRAAYEMPSYEAVGRFVVRNCDLLIALWNGKPARGQGGTAEIVHFAARCDVPIWWIDVNTCEARLITNVSQWRRLDRTIGGEAATTALVDYLSKLILRPDVAHPERHGILGRASHHYCRLVDYQPHPLELFLDEPAAQPSRGIWRAFDRFYRIIAPPDAPSPQPPPAAPDNDVHAYWAARYHRADDLSLAYGDRYRSSYVLIIVLAMMAFFMSIGGGFVVGEGIKVGLELATLFAVGLLVCANHVQRWQERWIAYRLVAELCRKQIMLAHLGRALPGTEVNRIALESPTEADVSALVSALPREAWVSWYYQAELRAAPPPPRSATLAKTRAYEIGRALVAEQTAYHAGRQKRSGAADRRLARYGDLCFIVTVAVLTLIVATMIVLAVVAKGRHVEAPWIETAWIETTWIETAASLFSGASAALVGLRAYAEFALLAQQSHRMQKIMRDTGAELAGLDLTTPLASQELGSLLQRLAGLMMQDVSGWAQLFRLKTVEPS